jgi:hypothetical protein
MTMTTRSHNALTRMVIDSAYMGTNGWNKHTLRALERRGYITVQWAINGCVRVTSAGEAYVRRHQGILRETK